MGPEMQMVGIRAEGGVLVWTIQVPEERMRQIRTGREAGARQFASAICDDAEHLQPYLEQGVAFSYEFTAGSGSPLHLVTIRSCPAT